MHAAADDDDTYAPVSNHGAAEQHDDGAYAPVTDTAGQDDADGAPADGPVYLEPDADQPETYANAKMGGVEDEGAYAPVLDTAEQDALDGFAGGGRPAQEECVCAFCMPRSHAAAAHHVRVCKGNGLPSALTQPRSAECGRATGPR